VLSHIKIVLVETTHPGNIGAVARAMKNMNMANLWLVSPKIFPALTQRPGLLALMMFSKCPRMQKFAGSHC